MIVVLMKKRLGHTEGRPYEDTWKKQLSASQGESSRRNQPY